MARKSNFDRNEKLTQAMQLFWQKGYSNTSISDLIETLQINRFSLYNSFGDKQRLYYEALETYLTSISYPGTDILSSNEASIEELEQFLIQFAELQKQNSCGCLIQNALVEHAGEDQVVLNKGNLLFDYLLNIITNAIINAQHQDKIASKHNANMMAQLILTQMQGMRVLGKAKRYDDLEAALKGLLALIKL